MLTQPLAAAVRPSGEIARSNTFPLRRSCSLSVAPSAGSIRATRPSFHATIIVRPSGETAAARVLPPETRIRSRRLSEADFRGEGKVLTGDLLPLVLAVVDAVDTLPGALPQPLQGRSAPSPEVRPAHQTATAALAAWALYGLSLPALALALAYLTMASVTFSIPLGIAGLAVGGWATRRFMWSRWLARANWGGDAPVPSWPIAEDERGIAPKGLELGLDVLALGSVAFTMLGDGLPHLVSLWALPFLGLGALVSALAVYEAWQRE